MMTFSSIQIRLGTTLLLDGANARINPGQKVGLVGKNGCGKSTLLALIRGEITAESGSFSIPENWTISWVKQETLALEKSAIEYVIDGETTFRRLETELEAANARNDGIKIAQIHAQLEIIDAWNLPTRAAILLHGLGFSEHDHNRSVRDFSGGWRMRLNLAQALIRHSDLLLLDEPTNHLDLDAVIWLEKWLKNYSGTLILISHDREFLDPIVDRIFHIENQLIHEYTGNYSSFELQRAEKMQQQNALYKQQQTKIAHLQSYIDRFKAKASKAKQAQSRVKMLEKIERVLPALADNAFQFSFPAPDKLPMPILTLDKCVVGYDDKTILESIKMNLVPGSRIGLLGRNGAGKSTLMKLLAGVLPPKSGIFSMSKEIKLGYFSQHQFDVLREEYSVLWHFMNLPNQKATEQELRNYLGGFNFHGDKVHDPVGQFSGGEKARLVLALLVWQKPNLLLLDEPTNHLDLEMRQALIEALFNYQGALVVVSHDRYLLRSVVDEFYLVHDQNVLPFDGDLMDYQRWLQEHDQGIKNESNEESTSSPTLSRKEQKQQEAEIRQKTQPLRKQIAEYETKLDNVSAQLHKIETALADNAIYDDARQDELKTLLTQQQTLTAKQQECEANWLSLQDEYEQLLQHLTQQ